MLRTSHLCMHVNFVQRLTCFELLVRIKYSYEMYENIKHTECSGFTVPSIGYQPLRVLSDFRNFIYYKIPYSFPKIPRIAHKPALTLPTWQDLNSWFQSYGQSVLVFFLWQLLASNSAQWTVAPRLKNSNQEDKDASVVNFKANDKLLGLSITGSPKTEGWLQISFHGTDGLPAPVLDIPFKLAPCLWGFEPESNFLNGIQSVSEQLLRKKRKVT